MPRTPGRSRNIRHHAVTWCHDELSLEWPDIALFLGDNLTTAFDRFVLQGADALAVALNKLHDL